MVFGFLGFQGVIRESVGVMIMASFVGFRVACYYTTIATFEANKRPFAAGGGSAVLPSKRNLRGDTMINLLVGLLVLLLAACGGTEPPTKTAVIDEERQPAELKAHNLDYYLENPDEADAIMKVCEETPSQARSEILEGNCSYAQKSMMYRGYHDR